MNPLSAIQQVAAGAKTPEMLPHQTASIPLRELQDLRPLMNPQPISATKEGSASFEGLLGHMVNEVTQKQAAAGTAVQGLMSGQPVPLHQAVIAMEEASVSFQLMVEVRNKLLESYQELMRMQI
jgi:flagellar hook-basal body complex protein FliE